MLDEGSRREEEGCSLWWEKKKQPEELSRSEINAVFVSAVCNLQDGAGWCHVGVCGCVFQMHDVV